MQVCADLAKQTHVATIYFFFNLFSRPMTEVKAYALIIWGVLSVQTRMLSIANALLRHHQPRPR